MAKRERKGQQLYPYGEELVPDDWRTPYRKDPKFAHVDVDDEAAAFRDRNLAHGTYYRDWRAAWRTWMRNAAKWTERGANGHTVVDRSAPEECPDAWARPAAAAGLAVEYEWALFRAQRPNGTEQEWHRWIAHRAADRPLHLN